MIEDFVSPRQFGDAMNEPELESPPRSTVVYAEKFNADQFQGFVGNDETPKAARHPNYVGGGQTVHQYRASPK